MLSGMAYRIIYSLYFELGPIPLQKPEFILALVVPLDRRGMPAGKRSDRNGYPRPPKRRTIDLRVGDEIWCGRHWVNIKKVEAHRDSWLTWEEAFACKGNEGFLYRVKKWTSPTRAREEVSTCGCQTVYKRESRGDRE